MNFSCKGMVGFKNRPNYRKYRPCLYLFKVKLNKNKLLYATKYSNTSPNSKKNFSFLPLPKSFKNNFFKEIRFYNSPKITVVLDAKLNNRFGINLNK